MIRLLRYLWPAPNTALGLFFCLTARLTGGEVRAVDGVLEAHGGWTKHMLRSNPLMPHGIAAITFGHVVVGRNPYELNRTRVHERVHVRQYERWGPLFLPAYFLSSAWCVCRRVDPYRKNVFEVEAYRIEAEHRERFG